MIDLTKKCVHCGQRRGKHRWGDEACPNRRWRSGNGKQQWLTMRFTAAKDQAA